MHAWETGGLSHHHFTTQDELKGDTFVRKKQTTCLSIRHVCSWALASLSEAIVSLHLYGGGLTPERAQSGAPAFTAISGGGAEIRDGRTDGDRLKGRELN